MKTKKSNEYKRARSILILGIINLLFYVTSLTLAIIFVTQYIIFITGGPDNEFRTSIKWLSRLAGAVYIGIISFIMTLVGSILTLTGKFNNKDVDALKTAMGILSLVLIGPIGLVVFSGIAMKKLKPKPPGDLDIPVDKILEPVL